MGVNTVQNRRKTRFVDYFYFKRTKNKSQLSHSRCARKVAGDVFHTCQLSRTNRESPDLWTFSRSRDRIKELSQFSRFSDHLPIS